MKKEILIALLCAGLMLVTPFTAVAQENKISSNLKEQPDVEELLTQIRVVIDEILEKYRHIPIIGNLCNMVLNSLGLLGNIIICILLIIIAIPIGLVAVILAILGFDNIALNLAALVFIIIDISGDYCTPYNSFISKLPLKSISTLIEINNISELDCPCLQNRK